MMNSLISNLRIHCFAVLYFVYHALEKLGLKMDSEFIFRISMLIMVSVWFSKIFVVLQRIEKANEKKKNN